MYESFEILHSYLMEALFAPINNQLRRDVREVALSNSNEASPFRYKGKLYNSPIFLSFSVAFELDNHLHPQMELLVKEQKEVKIEELKVSAYICRMLNLADSLIDVCNLLPESTHQYLNIIINKSINDSLPTLNLARITLTQESEKDAIQLINNRILTNLLLGDA